MYYNKLDIKDYRYERKFFISQITKHQIESIIKIHPSLFSEIYQQRHVNNIYLDTNSLNNYFDNCDGVQNRIKVRIRWYGRLFGNIKKPNLEFKIKNGLLGKKNIFKLQSFEINKGFNNYDIFKIIQNSDIPVNFKKKIDPLTPTLLNKYTRKYFQSFDKKYRLTIDTDQAFYKISRYNNLFLNKLHDKDNVILELKYNSCFDKNISNITNHFLFRLTKSSKYVSGINKVFQIV